jgi:hypothetical protein
MISKMLLGRATCLIFAATACLAGEIQNIPTDDLGKEFQLIGKLHVPFGKVVTIEGVAVHGPPKGPESGNNIQVQRIQGRTTQENIRILLRPLFADWGETVPTGLQKLPKLEIGTTYEMEGYEIGQFSGQPEGTFNGDVPIQTYGFQFHETFVVTKAKRIDAIKFNPGMFEGEQGLLQGKAVTIDGKAHMAGDWWHVRVLGDGAWPKEIEGKLIETRGMYNRDAERNTLFHLIDGEWQLVTLEDQVGRHVALRGTARSMNDVWWFNYRGTNLYVEDITSLPGWTNENHWRPMTIEGRLEKTVLPDVDQIARKADRDLKEYFIVRDATWKPLPALLSPELPSE